VSSTIGEDHAKEDAKQRAYADDLVALLVFHVGNQEPKAVPLSLVARLEEVDVKDIEHSDGQMMVQYRGRLMPLVKFDSSYELRSEGRQPMLVFADGERSMGLIVDEIVDIVEEALDIELVSKQERLIGSAVVDGKATEIIDVAYYLTSALGDWFSEKGASSGSGAVEKNRILLVDDSPFFRNMLVPLLNVAGYQVTTAGTADEALELRDSGQHFDVIISDIEMPGMNGFEFAEAVKTDGRWDETPLVALSSHTTPQDFDRGRQAGFVDYVSKTNRDALLDVLSQTLAVTGGAA
jgi:two-component system chemotaxis sensor kinase CheA